MPSKRKSPTNAKKTARFKAAIDASDGATVDKMLVAGFRVDTPFDSGRTPLMAAAGNGDIAMVERLLGAGAAIRETNTKGQDALYFALAPDFVGINRAAAHADHDGVALLLLNRGARVGAVHLMLMIHHCESTFIERTLGALRTPLDRTVIEEGVRMAKASATYESSVSDECLKASIHRLVHDRR
ncbi:MAG: ankyrin repeat domain-containing protein [Pseudomonadota bacterium]